MPITATVKTSLVVESLPDVMELTKLIFEFIDQHGKQWESEIQVNWTHTSHLEHPRPPKKGD